MQSSHQIKHSFIFSMTVALCFLSRVALAQNCQSNNYAANKTAVASDGNDMAGNILDGNLTTDWYGGADSKWIYVDLGANQNLCKITLKWGYWSSIPQTVVQGSTDASNWTNLYTIAASDHGTHSGDNTNGYDYIDVDLSSTTTAYRYVRLYYASGTSWGPHLKELEVYLKQPTVTPTVSITAPTDGATAVQGSNITLSATASETGGSINKVEFYANNALIGQVLTSPYNFTWNNVQAGDYTIIAHAHDASGQMAASSGITLHVSVPAGGWSFAGNYNIPTGSFLGTTDNYSLVLKAGNQEGLRITPTGQVSIGTTDPKTYKLAVNGDAIFTKIKVKQNSAWPDYVFHANYKLPSFRELENYIKQYRHLPGLPSANEINKEGAFDVGQQQTVLLQKIEELTLYMLQMNKDMAQMNEAIKKLEQENTAMKKQIRNKKK